jgi:hypothetical protein
MNGGDEHLTPVPEAEAKAEIVRASRAGKISAALLVLVGIGLLALFQFYLFPVLKSTVAVTPPPHALLIVKAAFFTLSGLGALCGLVMMWYGRKILRSGQCPPPDAWLARDTKVRRGPRAQRFGWTYIVCGALACALCLALAAIVATLHLPLERRWNQHQPVIILQQKYSGKP